MSSDAWARWASARATPGVLHLDSAAAGRSSLATLAATAAHARLEAEVGAYVAQQRAGERIETLRADLGTLLGLPAAGVAFVESATAALEALLRAWPLPAGARVGLTPGEWGPNVESFRDQGMAVVDLPVEPSGCLDLAAFERLLATDPPDLVHLCQIASHRGLAQPVLEAAAACRSHGVPLWVDAAQAVGQVPAAVGADAVYATSRKWLAGPRGVGVLGVHERHWDALRVPRRAKVPVDLPPVRALESGEAHVSGRVGLANAVAELLASGPDAVAARLAEVGRTTRDVLATVPGWAVAGSGHTGAVTALRPTGGQDVEATRERLLSQHGILTTACLPWRAPGELDGPVLRLSPHVDCTAAALDRVADALAAG